MCVHVCRTGLISSLMGEKSVTQRWEVRCMCVRLHSFQLFLHTDLSLGHISSVLSVSKVI